MSATVLRLAPTTLKLQALAQVEAATRLGGEPYEAVDRLAQDLLGHNFCTVMRWWPESHELERIYSSRREYPVGGRKSKRGLAWADTVIHAREIYVGASEEDLANVFEDHRALVALGLGSVINTPIVFGHACLGTFNLLNEAGWYRPEDEQVTRILAHMLVPALLSGAKP